MKRYNVRRILMVVGSLVIFLLAAGAPRGYGG